MFKHPWGLGTLGDPSSFFFISFLSVLFGDVVVQFYPWFNFYFLLFLGMIVCDNEFETKENKN